MKLGFELAGLLSNVADNLKDAAMYDAEGDDMESAELAADRSAALNSVADICQARGLRAGVHALYNEFDFVSDYAEEEALEHMNIRLYDIH